MVQFLLESPLCHMQCSYVLSSNFILLANVAMICQTYQRGRKHLKQSMRTSLMLFCLQLGNVLYMFILAEAFLLLNHCVHK